jgi:hypothetical protein
MSRLSQPKLEIVTTESFAGIEGERPALVTPRAYDLRFDSFETARMFGRAMKLILWFTIAEPGDEFDKKLPRYYNVARLIGAPGQGGGFKVAPQSDFLREYVTLFGMPSRLDRFSMSNFKGCFVSGKVKTVTTGHKQKEIPKPLQYSVIEEIRGLKK